MQAFFTILSTILVLAAFPPYVIDTIRGKTRPERATWFIFSILGIIAFISQLALGATWSLVFSGFDTAASIVVFILSITYGVGGYTKLDISALTVAITGAFVAVFAHEPIVSLIGVIVADLSGVALTIKKVYEYPKSETTISWVLVGTASLFGALSVSKLAFGTLLYPIYLMLVNYAVPIVQVLRRNKNR